MNLTRVGCCIVTKYYLILISRARNKLIFASVLCLVFMIAEVVGGVLSNSLAIATDAAHLLTDFASFMISLFAIWVAGRPRLIKYFLRSFYAHLVSKCCRVHISFTAGPLTSFPRFQK